METDGCGVQFFGHGFYLGEWTVTPLAFPGHREESALW